MSEPTTPKQPLPEQKNAPGAPRPVRPNRNIDNGNGNVARKLNF